MTALTSMTHQGLPTFATLSLTRARGLATFTVGLAALLAVSANAAESYRLQTTDHTGQPVDVRVELEVGGNTIARPTDETATSQTMRVQPMTISGKLHYQELLLTAGQSPRSVRQYRQADATLKTSDRGVERTLPSGTAIVCQWQDSTQQMQAVDQPLARKQLDLVNVVGSTLTLDRLLPNKTVREGDSWDHEDDAIAALLGMEHLAVCEVSSVIAGEDNRQVQIRMAGAVHGRKDGAATEMEVKGAYLYHLDLQRITKFNLAIKEKRSASEVTPGLDVVAKLKLHLRPATGEPIEPATVAQAAAYQMAPQGKFLMNSPERGFRFSHSAQWYVTADRREMISMRLMKEGALAAHCNVSTLPARAPGRAATLEEFKRDVQQSLDSSVDQLLTAKEWTSPKGHRCFGVFANGTVEDVPVQWRYYLVAADHRPRVTVAVTVEQSLLAAFGDSDRPIIDSMDLIAEPTLETADKSGTTK